MRRVMQHCIASGMAVSLALSSGCSFALVHGGKPSPAAVNDCTTSRLGPILDSVFTAVMLITVVQSLATSDAEWQKQLCDVSDPNCSPPISQGGAALIFSPLALLGAAGMYYGFTRTSECHDLQPRIEDAPQPMPTTVVTPPVAAPAVVTPPVPAPAPPVLAPPPVAAPTPTAPTAPPTTAVPANPYGAAKPAPVVKRKLTPKPKPDAPPAPPVGIPLPGGP